VLIVLNRRKIEWVALLFWIIGTAILGGFFLFDTPQSARYIIAAPVLCIVAAMAIAKFGSLLRRILGMPQRWGTAFIAIVTAAIMLGNLYFYFEIYTPRNAFARTDAVTEIAHYLASQTGQSYVYMFTAPFYYLDYGTIKFVGNQPNGTDVLDHLRSASALAKLPNGLRPLFVFIPDRLSELEIVKQLYPDGQLNGYRKQPENNQTLFYIYEPRP